MLDPPQLDYINLRGLSPLMSTTEIETVVYCNQNLNLTL